MNETRLAHLVVTAITLVGGGFLVHLDPPVANAVYTSWGVVLTWWFVKNGDNISGPPH